MLWAAISPISQPIVRPIRHPPWLLHWLLGRCAQAPTCTRCQVLVVHEAPKSWAAAALGELTVGEASVAADQALPIVHRGADGLFGQREIEVFVGHCVLFHQWTPGARRDNKSALRDRSSRRLAA